MTRTMYDSVNWQAIPTTATMVAGYLPPSRYAWPAEAWARFPTAVKVKIAVRASTNDGHVLDVEPGDATPAEAPGWVQRRRAAGVDPTVYCSWSQWPLVRAAFSAAGVAQPHYWIARYDGIPEIPAGAVAKQFADPTGSGGQWDLSVVADYWPGVDQGGNVGAVTEDTQSYIDTVNRVADIEAKVSAFMLAQEAAGPMVTLLLDAIGRVEALIKGTDQTFGPSKDTNQLARDIDAIKTQAAAVTLSDAQLAQLADLIGQRITPGASAADVRDVLTGVTFTTKAQ